MKKLILVFIFVLCTSTAAFSEVNKVDGFKKFFNKASGKNQEVVVSQSTLNQREQANLFYCGNDLAKALEAFLAIPETERTAQDWVLLGNILQDQERTSDAIFMYKRAILTDPKFYKPYYNLGNIYLSEDTPFLAIENYRKANKSKNDFAYGYYNLGCAYIQTGDLKKAKITFLKAIELKNNDPDFYYNLAYTYKKLEKPKLSKQYLDIYNKMMDSREQ